MRFIHTSDWHLGRYLHGHSLLEEQAHFLEWLIGIIDNESPDAVIIAGDIFDRPVPPIAAVELYDHFLAKVCVERRVPVLAIAGNHDSASRLEFGSSLYRTNGYYICGHIKRELETVTLCDEYGEIDFVLVPYFHPAEARSVLEDSSLRTFDLAYSALLRTSATMPAQRRCVAVAHGFFAHLNGPILQPSDSEISIGGAETADLAAFAGFDYIALGHLHMSQWPEKDRAHYSGSPLKYSLSEESHKKSVTLVNLGNKFEVFCEKICYHAQRDVRTVRGNFDDLLDLSYHQNQAFEDYVFVEIEGPQQAYAMEKLRHVFPNLLGIRFFESNENTTLPQADSEIKSGKLSTADLFGRFYRDIRDEEMPIEAEALIKILTEAEQ